MSFLTIEAYVLDDEFLSSIQSQFGVTLKDSSNAPWSVVFEGPRDQLIACNESLGNSNDDIDIEERYLA